jgi:hypothetical protein
MSFIDMMADDRWTEADIVNRTESMIRSEFPPDQESIINRIVTAAAAGMYQLTEEEQVQVARYNQACLEARDAGNAARVDMRLLEQALDYEVDKGVIDAASAEVKALVDERAQARSFPAG